MDKKYRYFRIFYKKSNDFALYRLDSRKNDYLEVLNEDSFSKPVWVNSVYTIITLKASAVIYGHAIKEIPEAELALLL